VSAVVLLLALAALALLEQPAASADAAPSWRPTEPPAFDPPPARRILFVILDAWRRKAAMDDARMPRMAELARLGSRGPVWTGPRTLTKACVREMLTGRPSSLRDATRNLMSDRVTEPSLMTRMREAGLSFALVDHIGDLRDLFAAQSPEGSIPRVSADGLAFDAADPAHDAVAEAAADTALADPSRRLVAVHLESLDLGGHIFYPDTPAYDLVLAQIDERVWRLSRRLDLSRDTLFVIGDHGADDHGHHGGPDAPARETAYLAAGAGIRPTTAPLDPADVADTLAALLNLCPPDGSHGAPEPALLALDPVRLKAHCDHCLRSRLSATATPPAKSESQGYFDAPAFTPAAAVAYKQLVAPRSARSWPRSALALALAAVAAGLWLARAAAGETRRAGFVLAAIVLLSLLLARDAIGVFGFVALLLARLPRESRAWALGALALVAALVLGWTTTLPGIHPGAVARAAGPVAAVIAGLVLLPAALRSTAIGRAAWISWTPLAAALASRLVRTDQIPGRFSPGVAMVDYALAAGALFLVLGWARRDLPVAALAALALAACLYQGWPLAVVALLALLPPLAGPRAAAAGSPWASLWPVLGALAALRAVNTGYGFSKIDLSLAVLGTRWEGEPDYAWGATVILFSYLLPVALIALTARPSLSVGGALDGVLAAFLCFAGADLAMLVLPGASPYSPVRLEDVFVFDVVLGLLAAAVAAVERAGARWAARLPRDAGYGLSGSVPASPSG